MFTSFSTSQNRQPSNQSGKLRQPTKLVQATQAPALLSNPGSAKNSDKSSRVERDPQLQIVKSSLTSIDYQKAKSQSKQREI